MWAPTSRNLTDSASGMHLVIRLLAGVLDPGLVGVHPLCGGITEGPVSQASGWPTVLDLERTQGRMRSESDGTGTSVGRT